MKTTLRFPVLLLLTAVAASSASLLEQRIDQLFRTAHGMDSAAVGIEVVQLGTGKVIYSRDQSKLFTPASNTKLFSTALALSRLGPDYRISTRVYQSGSDLVVQGAGDPSMSHIQIPFDQDAKPVDPMVGIEALADQIAARGIRSIPGDIVGDDTAFPFEPYPPGWGAGDAIWEYGAPVSALCLGSNSVKIDVSPGLHDGDPATLDMLPVLEYFTIDNRVVTGPVTEGGLAVRRLGGRELELGGSIPSGASPKTLWLAVDDPALYAATALHDALTRRGIAITGHPVARHRDEGKHGAQITGIAIAERQSPPLAELLRVTDKVSQNLWAELLLRQVALVRAGDGSRRAGLEELHLFLKEIGLEDADYLFEDGSGLSRTTLVKPSAIVRLLQFMYNSKQRDIWVSLMPVGGQDGSLAKRFGKDPAARAIQAKTGSLSHVNALSGYADSATFGQLAFAIVINHTNVPASEVRDFIDKIGMSLLE